MSQVVGSRLQRPEGPDKVTGRAAYAADLTVEGSWFGGTVRSRTPRGRLRGFDLDPAFDFESVVLVRAGDVPGDNVIALIDEDQPVLAEDSVRHHGEPLLLVAAPNPGLLKEALAAVRPRVDAEDAHFDMETADHVFREITIEKGDAAQVLAEAARVVEGVYRTDSQEQMYIEPQGCIAWPAESDGTVLVKGSMQCPYFVRKALARTLGVAPEKARVVQTVTGGGFGGKEEYPSVLACHAALLARAAGAPVSMIYDRAEDLAFTPKRHPSRVRHRTAVDDEGRLLAMDVDVLLDGGAYSTLSPVVLSRACIHAAGAYRCEHVHIRGRVVRTHHVPYGAFRGFGAPQVCFAVERQMDRVARELGLHPAALRERNQLRIGDTTATGQRLEESVGSRQVLESVLRRSGFDRHPWGASKATEDGRVRRGLGLSFFFHGSGFTGSGEELLKSRVEVQLRDDGRAEVRTISTEFGQGTETLFVALAADALDTVPGDVVLTGPDTAVAPDSGPTVASRTCMVVGSCVVKACRQLVQRMEAVGGEGSFRERARAFLAAGGDGLARVTYRSPPNLSWDEQAYRGDAYPTYGWAADVAEVEVDLDTFEVRVTRVWTAVDVGKAIQPQLVEGQVEGGTLQAVGFAHLEVVDTEEGRFRQDRMATCIIPTCLDAPPFDVELIEEPFSHGPFGAKGVGELPMDGGAPAVVSAIEDALGIVVDRIPATSERLAEAWIAQNPDELT